MKPSRRFRQLSCVIGFVALWLLLPAHAQAAEVEPLVVYDHTSNAFRGFPLNAREELQAEYLGAGVTITAGTRKRWEIDITHGVMSVEGETFEQASKLTVRFYPRRGR